MRHAAFSLPAAERAAKDGTKLPCLSLSISIYVHVPRYEPFSLLRRGRLREWSGPRPYGRDGPPSRDCQLRALGCFTVMAGCVRMMLRSLLVMLCCFFWTWRRKTILAARWRWQARRSQTKPRTNPLSRKSLTLSNATMTPPARIGAGGDRAAGGGRHMPNQPLAAGATAVQPHHLGVGGWVSRPEEFHPRPLAERCVNLSIHTAPIR
jgi:hypothetical protein